MAVHEIVHSFVKPLILKLPKVIMLLDPITLPPDYKFCMLVLF